MTSKRYIYANEFHDIFGVFLVDFWDKWFGFKIVEFDAEVIKPPDGVSCHDHIKARYGERAAQIVHELNSEAPLLERLQAARS